MNKKIIAGVVLLTLATAGTLTYAASTNTSTGNTLRNVFSEIHRAGSGGLNTEHFNDKGGERRGFGQGNGQFGMMNISKWFGFMRGWSGSQLTDAEKTKLATMTDTEKQVFFQAKMTEQKALHDTKEAVIDKLINGETLTDAEKVTLAIIKTERATMKAQQVAREAQMTEMKSIMEKIKAGTTLTTDEQTKLNAFKKTMPQMQENNNNRGSGRGMMGR